MRPPFHSFTTCAYLLPFKIRELEIEAYFGGGAPCRDAEVTIYDNEWDLYMEGVTDDDGQFGFQPKIGTDDCDHEAIP
jgi:hypothetical protein